MKIIELLEKIAKGEQPRKIKFRGEIFEWDKNDQNYWYRTEDFSFDPDKEYYGDNALQDFFDDATFLDEEVEVLSGDGK